MNSSLPADAPDPIDRQARLAAAQIRWQLDLDKLPGVAMCRGVPLDDLPTWRWLATAGQGAVVVLLNLVDNAIAWAEHDHRSAPGHDAPTLIEEAMLRSTREGLLALQLALEGAEAADGRPGDELVPLEEITVGIEDVGGWLQAQINAIFGGLSAPLALFEEHSPYYAYTYGGVDRRVGGVAAVRTLFRTLPEPPSASTLFDDAAFARRRLCGPNPGHIAAISRLPDSIRLPDAALQAATTPGDRVAAALAEGRLFSADYRVLADALEPAAAGPRGRKFFYAPIALFAVPPGGGTLRPVAVQCEPERGGPLFTPADGWAWAMARHTVEVADMAHFEVSAHLASTHLLMESVALATRRCLDVAHPVARLLAAHIEGTIAVNDAAVNHLLADGGAVAQTFGATIESVRSLAAHVLRTHDFRAMALPSRLARRGTLDAARLVDYPYRDDGIDVWHAIQRWAKSYVMHVYASESALAGDPEIRAWADTLGGPVAQGGLAGFGPVNSRADLIEVLALIIFTASAQHAAVNFPQWSDAAYAPAMSGAGWAPAPDRTTGYTRDDWLAMLPPVGMCELQAGFLYVLGHTYHTPLGDYGQATAPGVDGLGDLHVSQVLLPAFRVDLSQIEARITARNAGPRREAPYHHLLPSRIPRSINV